MQMQLNCPFFNGWEKIPSKNKNKRTKITTLIKNKTWISFLNGTEEGKSSLMICNTSSKRVEESKTFPFSEAGKLMALKQESNSK